MSIKCVGISFFCSWIHELSLLTCNVQSCGLRVSMQGCNVAHLLNDSLAFQIAIMHANFRLYWEQFHWIRPSYVFDNSRVKMFKDNARNSHMLPRYIASGCKHCYYYICCIGGPSNVLIECGRILIHRNLICKILRRHSLFLSFKTRDCVLYLVVVICSLVHEL